MTNKLLKICLILLVYLGTYQAISAEEDLGEAPVYDKTTEYVATRDTAQCALHHLRFQDCEVCCRKKLTVCFQHANPMPPEARDNTTPISDHDYCIVAADSCLHYCDTRQLRSALTSE